MRKITQEERIMQGGTPCRMCGANSPCGDIYSCAWWAGEPEQPKQRQPGPSINELCAVHDHDFYAVVDREGVDKYVTCYCGKRVSFDEADITEFEKSA